MNKVLLLQTSIADYRDHFIRSLNDYFEIELTIKVGECYFEESTKTSAYVRSLENVELVRNLFLFNRKFCFQFIKLSDVLRSDVVVFELNPHLISNWVFMLMRTVLRKKNVLWGHAWSRSGPDSKTELLRALMRAMSDNLLLYTEEQKTEIVQSYPKLKNRTYVAPNSLYAAEDMGVASGDSSDVVYVGRLVASKKVDLLIRSFAKVVARDSSRRLHLIGSGPDYDSLVDLASKLSVSKYVKFHGHISDFDRLKEVYGQSLMSISPGYVGLSITQSFAFGRPMLIALDEPHSPELEAFNDGENGLFFESDSEESLASAMIEMFDRSAEWSSKFTPIVNHCRNTYSVERMVRGFVDAVEK